MACGRTAGSSLDAKASVLRDWTVKGSPRTWGKAVVSAYHRHDANLVVAEGNQGGALDSLVLAVEGATGELGAVAAERDSLAAALALLESEVEDLIAEAVADAVAETAAGYEAVIAEQQATIDAQTGQIAGYEVVIAEATETVREQTAALIAAYQANLALRRELGGGGIGTPD